MLVHVLSQPFVHLSKFTFSHPNFFFNLVKQSMHYPFSYPWGTELKKKLGWKKVNFERCTEGCERTSISSKRSALCVDNFPTRRALAKDDPTAVGPPSWLPHAIQPRPARLAPAWPHVVLPWGPTCGPPVQESSAITLTRCCTSRP